MSAATVSPASARRATVTRAVVSQLALAEGRRLVRHPLVLAGLALSLAGGIAAALTPHEQAGELAFIMLSGGGAWPLAVGAFLAANLTAARTRRHGTVELEDTTVTGAADRTLGILTAMGSLVLVAIALLAVDVAMLRAWDGVAVRLEEGFVHRSMHPAELAQGPLAVGFLAALGVAFGRWVPSRLVGPLMLVPAVVGFFHATWRFPSSIWRFAPVMAHEQQVGWVQVTPSSGYSIIADFAVGDLAWHLLYLLGLTVVVAALAVARFDRGRRVRIAGSAGIVLAVLGGIQQLP